MTQPFREFYFDQAGEEWDDPSLDKNKLSARFKGIADFLDEISSMVDELFDERAAARGELLTKEEIKERNEISTAKRGVNSPPADSPDAPRRPQPIDP